MSSLWMFVRYGAPYVHRNKTTGRVSQKRTIVLRCACGTMKTIRSDSLRNSYSCGCVPSPKQALERDKLRAKIGLALKKEEKKDP